MAGETQSLPVTVIGGYLGAGKTTLINHLLRQAGGMRLAVLVNDFGELPIDADLIESQDGDIISITGGCMCCAYGSDLMVALVAFDKLDSSINWARTSICRTRLSVNSMRLTSSSSIRSISQAMKDSTRPGSGLLARLQIAA